MQLSPTRRVYEDVVDRSDGCFVKLRLDVALQRLERDNPPGLLIAADVVRHALGRQRVGPR